MMVEVTEPSTKMSFTPIALAVVFNITCNLFFLFTSLHQFFLEWTNKTLVLFFCDIRYNYFSEQFQESLILVNMSGFHLSSSLVNSSEVIDCEVKFFRIVYSNLNLCHHFLPICLICLHIKTFKFIFERDGFVWYLIINLNGCEVRATLFRSAALNTIGNPGLYLVQPSCEPILRLTNYTTYLFYCFPKGNNAILVLHVQNASPRTFYFMPYLYILLAIKFIRSHALSRHTLFIKWQL